ncbi:hypothetical protein GCM10025864_21730 [Luteimicrobium album]|uniref:Signal transduction histidine kinase n=1 Tax=Luteimicrobium album TaxID=1054550 RepID=A0ABQ6I100_9MICO|nr:hypothetical protein [Luteimicrobium album]GMA24414.1 hypothetical protein GCM10025864_21730 [Luteimicrobium album]
MARTEGEAPDGTFLEPARSLPQAERAAGLAVAGLRVATFAQMAPSVVTAVDVSQRPTLCLATWLVATVAVVSTAVLAVARRRPPGPRWACVEVTVATGLLLAGTATVPDAYRTGSWVGFQGAYTLSVACGLLGVRRRATWVTLLGVLVAARAVFVLPVLGSGTGAATMVGELLTLLCLPPLAWAGTGAVYRIASDADRAREYAARLARDEEARRARTAIHNGTALLKLLVERAALDPADGRTPSQVWVQAASEVNRMRAYLAGQEQLGPSPADAAPHDLAILVESVGAEFADLPLDVVPDLARGLRLGAEAPDVVVALRSLLINVRQHAEASRVVLHAEQREDGTGWTVTLHDDGVGFDLATTTFGVGVRGLVVDALAAHDITTTFESVPGLGTTVVLRGDRIPLVLAEAAATTVPLWVVPGEPRHGRPLQPGRRRNRRA